jgi:hypothetical protein
MGWVSLSTTSIHSHALIVQDGPLASLLGVLDHTHTDTRQDSSGRVINPSQRPLPTQDNTIYKDNRKISMPRAGFEPANPATKRPQTYALDRAVTQYNIHYTYIVGDCPPPSTRPRCDPQITPLSILSLCVQTGSGAHPASCTMGTGGPFPGAKARPGVTLTTHPYLVPRRRMSRSYTSTPPTPLRRVVGQLSAFSVHSNELRLTHV